MRFLARLLLNGVAIIVAAWLLPGLHTSGPFPAVIAGVILGGVSAWMRQSRWRRRARRLSAELKAARAESEKLRRQLDAAAARPQPQGSIAAIAYRHPHAA